MTKLQADLLLILATAIWGTTFIIVKQAVSLVDPFVFLTLRFLLASIVLLLAFHRHIFPIKREHLQGGLIVGFFLFGGYAFQTVGLQYTSAAKAGFITGLSVVLVPIIVSILTRIRPNKAVIYGITLALMGLALLSWEPQATITNTNLGDLLVLLGAIAFAGQIVAVGFIAPKSKPGVLAFWQILFTTIFSALMMQIGPQKLTRDYLFNIPADAWIAIIITGVLATALVFLIQMSSQRYTTASHAALIFALEPVFAYLFAFIVAGEVLTRTGILGAVLIITGMLIAELVPLKTSTG